MKTAVALLVLFLMSCATVGAPIPKDALAQIKRGETTKIQVIALLGNPQIVSRADNGEEMYSYHYARIVPGAVTDQQFLSVNFGQDNIVTKAITMDFPH